MTIFTLQFWWLTIAPTWYWLMYALSFIIWLYFIEKQFPKKVSNLLFYGTVLGVILWGRLWYVLLYNLDYYLMHPIEIFMPWKGGMSFHGGMIGVIMAWYIVARKTQYHFLEVVDRMIWIIPIGLFFGRIGNYINGELFWMPGYEWFWATVIAGISYFPTPLLEAIWEWAILFVILLMRKKNILYPWQLGVWFITLYGIIRFLIEFLRIPDGQIWYILDWWLTLWQIFSILMIIGGIVTGNYVKYTYKTKNKFLYIEN